MNIKIKKDTPFDKIGTILSLEAFKTKYSYLMISFGSDDLLPKYLREGYKIDSSEFKINEWFEVLEINSFKVGDWVFHNKEKQAFQVVEYQPAPIWKPNNVSIGAVNQFTEFYTRLATIDEVNDNMLWHFLDEKLLIGKKNCYYFNNIWHELENVTYNIKTYLNNLKTSQFSKVLTYDNGYECNFSGLKIGCQILTDSEIKQIAKILDIQ